MFMYLASKPHMTCDQLAQIEVPGNWECQGHSFPIYTNFQYPWPITAPFVPKDNPTGCYRKHFTIPPSWKGERCGPFCCRRHLLCTLSRLA